MMAPARSANGWVSEGHSEPLDAGKPDAHGVLSGVGVRKADIDQAAHRVGGGGEYPRHGRARWAATSPGRPGQTAMGPPGGPRSRPRGRARPEPPGRWCRAAPPPRRPAMASPRAGPRRPGLEFGPRLRGRRAVQGARQQHGRDDGRGGEPRQRPGPGQALAGPPPRPRARPARPPRAGGRRAPAAARRADARPAATSAVFARATGAIAAGAAAAGAAGAAPGRSYTRRGHRSGRLEHRSRPHTSRPATGHHGMRCRGPGRRAGGRHRGPVPARAPRRPRRPAQPGQQVARTRPLAGVLGQAPLTSGRIGPGRPDSPGPRAPPGTSASGRCPSRTGRPVAANASTAPRLNTSLVGPTPRPTACSGDMNPGEPTTIPAWVSMLASGDREIPKSITRGPSPASSTLAGFRSRCTTPAAWIAPSPWARPAARRQHRGHRQRPLRRHRLGQRRPGHVRRGQPRRRRMHVRVEHQRGEPPADVRGRGHLPGEPLPESGLLGQLRADDFHRRQRPGAGPPQEYLAHSARPSRPSKRYGPAQPGSPIPHSPTHSRPSLPVYAQPAAPGQLERSLRRVSAPPSDKRRMRRSLRTNRLIFRYALVTVPLLYRESSAHFQA